MTERDARAVAPNILERAYLLRPVMAQPPLCTLTDLKTVLTVDDLADLHEILDLRELVAKRESEANGNH